MKMQGCWNFKKSGGAITNKPLATWASVMPQLYRIWGGGASGPPGPPFPCGHWGGIPFFGHTNSQTKQCAPCSTCPESVIITHLCTVWNTAHYILSEPHHYLVDFMTNWIVDTRQAQLLTFFSFFPIHYGRVGVLAKTKERTFSLKLVHFLGRYLNLGRGYFKIRLIFSRVF